MRYFIGRAALSWMDGTAFNGSDIIDRHAQPKVCDYLHSYAKRKKMHTFRNHQCCERMG
jgi:hypothetical protein